MTSEWRTCFRPVAHLRFAFVFRAMCTGDEFAIGFHAVANDLAMAVAAFRSERVNRALEAVEGVGCVVLDYLERLVIVVPADFTSRHIALLFIHLTRLRGPAGPLHRAAPVMAIGAFLCC